MSSSTRTLPIVVDTRINEACVLRRNVKRQPYGRCSVCSLAYSNCHAMRASLMSFFIIVSLLSLVVVPDGWPRYALVLAVIGMVIVQGKHTHTRTDELIFKEHQLQQTTAALERQNRALDKAREGLERKVAERTRELRQRNMDVARANVELIEADRQRSRLVVDLSHELRTPLTTIKGSAQNLLDGIVGELGARQREYLQMIVEESDRLIDSARTIVEVARGKAIRVELVLAHVDFSQWLGQLGKRMQASAVERGLELDVVVPGEPVEVEVDESKLGSIVENLVSNAIKFTDAGGLIEVVGTANDGELRVSVRDTGIGISEQDLARVFERFARADVGRPGHGVGLSLSRELARMHGGDIEVTSQSGQGSEFVVSLPRYAR